MYLRPRESLAKNFIQYVLWLSNEYSAKLFMKFKTLFLKTALQEKFLILNSKLFYAMFVAWSVRFGTKLFQLRNIWELKFWLFYKNSSILKIPIKFWNIRSLITVWTDVISRDWNLRYSNQNNIVLKLFWNSIKAVCQILYGKQ